MDALIDFMPRILAAGTGRVSQPPAAILGGMRSWPRFSLKGLLAAMTLLAVGFAWPSVLPVAVGLIVAWCGADLYYALVIGGAVAILQMAYTTVLG
jgi:hypothetical protein